MSHATSTNPTVDELLALFAGPDPDLALIHADPHTYGLAHPCVCDALCVCEETP